MPHICVFCNLIIITSTLCDRNFIVIISTGEKMWVTCPTSYKSKLWSWDMNLDTIDPKPIWLPLAISSYISLLYLPAQWVRGCLKGFLEQHTLNIQNLAETTGGGWGREFCPSGGSYKALLMTDVCISSGPQGPVGRYGLIAYYKSAEKKYTS